MSETIEPGLLHRLRHTPLRDLLRLRATGRLDLKAHIGASGLPLPVQDLIGRLVRRTRLWRLEKADVADELIAHFADGIESGRTVDELIESFGDERAAAQLIRRAKKRNRPLAWQLFNGLRWLIAGLVVFYGVLAVVFFTGRPSPDVDYIAVLNQPVANVPPDQRAWPTYRQAILQFRGPQGVSNEWDKLADARPGSKRWPETRSWLQEHARSIELIRQGSRKPAFGFVLGATGDIADPQLWPNACPPADTAALISVLLPFLGEARQLARVLSADAALAREQGDGRRLLADVDAMLAMADQLNRRTVLVSDLVALGIRAMALSELEQTLVNRRELLSDGDLQDLAHRLSAPQTASDFISFAGERLMVYDIVQRIYTNDGQGDGRLTWEGIKQLQYYGLVLGTTRDYRPNWGGHLEMAIGPASLVVTANRKELIREYDSLMDRSEANLHRPMREADWRPYNDRIVEIRQSPAERMRFTVLMMLAPALQGVQQSAERLLGQRDGLLAGIALEIHRRRHGGYPASLDGLSPGLLPAVPPDRITGEPARYRLVDGRPLVYSVGSDRDDDGGRPAKDRSGQGNANLAAQWNGSRAPDGDWPLYPQPPAPRREEE